MTKFDPKIPFDQAQDRHHRKSIRLAGYDYTQAGMYFVTIVTFQRDCLFGEIANGEMQLNEYGKIADECWRAIPDHFPSVELGAHIIMPNHAHGIISITDDAGRGAAMLRSYDANENPHKINVKPGSLGAIVRSYKSAVSYRINKELNATSIWQRNYYEHIIRDDREMDNIWRYIESNPANWEKDKENRRMPSQN